MLARVPELLIVPASSPYRTLADLVADAKARPGRVSYASGGAGTVSRFVTERLARQADIQLLHVPFKGNGDAIRATIAGQVGLMFDQMSSSLPHVKSGRLRALAVTATTRQSVLPDVPTIAEAGVKGVEDYTWIAFVVPAAVPRERLDQLHALVVKVMQSSAVRDRFIKEGLEPVTSTSDELTAYIRTEVARLGKLAHDAHITLD
jgi:tripartite-type tricarboxylate transporter receptor subunit TctC